MNAVADIRHRIGSTVRRIRRPKNEGVGHDFIDDVRDRLPHIEISTIFDIGAHIGITALEFRDNHPLATVHAFEPHPGNFARMKSNLVGAPEVRLHQIGLGAEPGTLPFHFDPQHPSMARIASHGETVTDTVAIDTIDRFCEQRGIDQIDLMKIDVEGHEMPVLHGAERMLSEGRVGIVKLETAIDPDLSYHTQLSDLTEYLHPFGYRIFGFYDQWENTLASDQAKLRRFDVAFISPTFSTR